MIPVSGHPANIDQVQAAEESRDNLSPLLQLLVCTHNFPETELANVIFYLLCKVSFSIIS